MGRASNKKKEQKPLRLDFGCGPHPADGFDGVDRHAFDGKVKHVVDLLATAPGVDAGSIAEWPRHGAVHFRAWPWKDGSVEQARASHFLEHLWPAERIHFWNELYRVLVPGGQAEIITPHWASSRAYGDPTHAWPPVSEMAFYYLKKEWRLANAPHTDASVQTGGFSCDLVASWGYALRDDLNVRDEKYRQFAVANYKEVVTDMAATVTKPAAPR